MLEFIHIVVCINIHSCVLPDASQFVNPINNYGHLGYSQFGAITNKTAMCTSLYGHKLLFLLGK